MYCILFYTVFWIFKYRTDFTELKILLLRKQINIGKLQFIGIKKEFQNKNVGSLLNYETLVEMKRRGYIGAEVGVIDGKNAIAHSTIAKTGAKKHKIYRVFEKNI